MGCGHRNVYMHMHARSAGVTLVEIGFSFFDCSGRTTIRLIVSNKLHGRSSTNAYGISTGQPRDHIFFQNDHGKPHVLVALERIMLLAENFQEGVLTVCPASGVATVRVPDRSAPFTRTRSKRICNPGATASGDEWAVFQYTTRERYAPQRCMVEAVFSTLHLHALFDLAETCICSHDGEDVGFEAAALIPFFCKVSHRVGFAALDAELAPSFSC